MYEFSGTRQGSCAHVEHTVEVNQQMSDTGYRKTHAFSALGLSWRHLSMVIAGIDGKVCILKLLRFFTGAIGKALGLEGTVIGRKFDLAVFCARVQATPKESNVLRQDLVRGLKDYYEATYGYDRYGAETIFMVPERMSEPYIFGFGCRRIFHDRRISPTTKAATARLALDTVIYGHDGGIPFAFFGILALLATERHLSVHELRYGLVVSAGETAPFRGLEKAEYLDFFRQLLACEAMPPIERLFWSHSLIARHQDGLGEAELINLVVGDERFAIEDRYEVCAAWLRFRQPRLAVSVPITGSGFRAEFIAEHMPFWIAHSPSWPLPTMVRLALTWLPRLGADPTQMCEEYIAYGDTFSDQVRAAVADIMAEHHARMSDAQVKRMIDQGIAISGSSPIRRKFYQLGTTLFGPEYLERATCDSANSVRQWAARQKLKQA